MTIFIISIVGGYLIGTLTAYAWKDHPCVGLPIIFVMCSIWYNFMAGVMYASH